MFVAIFLPFKVVPINFFDYFPHLSFAHIWPPQPALVVNPLEQKPQLVAVARFPSAGFLELDEMVDELIHRFTVFSIPFETILPRLTYAWTMSFILSKNMLALSFSISGLFL